MVPNFYCLHETLGEWLNSYTKRSYAMYDPNKLSGKRLSLVLAGSALSGLAISGCSGGVASKPCEALSTSGHQLHPSRYPVGNVKVIYQESRTAFNDEESTTGVISESNGEYSLNVKNLPKSLANDYTEFANTNAAVAISAPQTGEIGFTTGCINRIVDPQYNIPTAIVTLPTS